MSRFATAISQLGLTDAAHAAHAADQQLPRRRLGKRLDKLVDFALATYKVADRRAELVERRSRRYSWLDNLRFDESSLSFINVAFSVITFYDNIFVAHHLIALYPVAAYRTSYFWSLSRLSPSWCLIIRPIIDLHAVFAKDGLDTLNLRTLIYDPVDDTRRYIGFAESSLLIKVYGERAGGASQAACAAGQ